MVKAMTDKDFQTMAVLHNGAPCGDCGKRIRKAFKKHGRA
jgi:hypothetical protein